MDVIVSFAEHKTRRKSFVITNVTKPVNYRHTVTQSNVILLTEPYLAEQSLGIGMRADTDRLP